MQSRNSSRMKDFFFTFHKSMTVQHSLSRFSLSISVFAARLRRCLHASRTFSADVPATLLTVLFLFSESLVCDTLDLSGQGLKKLSRCPSDADINTLIIDDNELQRLDNLDSYHKITKLSIIRNQLLRMYGVSKLHNLVTLNLANNGILTIEGIKDMINLQTLCLAGNNIKSIEHLHTNTKLEHLDLSENSISHISDISYLRNLKELFLHNNRIITLRQCERYLPTSLETLTLANNNITDLNEMSHLANLKNVVNFSIANNPCVTMTGNSIGFDYRPFVINWCMSLKSIDGYAVDPLESLKAEWLYSQGRGRQFRVGEHALLAQYLASVCPLSGESLENETDRKLRLILSKAQHHQQQLNQQSDTGSLSSVTMSPSPAARRRLSHNRTNSPRRPTSSRNSMKMKSPDRMVSSCHTDAMVSSCHGLLSGDHETLMTQSLDPNMLSGTLSNKTSNNSLQDMEETVSSPLQAATKLLPVPESLMSPDFRPPSGLSRILLKTPTSSKLSSPCQITIPSKPSMDGDGKTIPIINTANPMIKTNLSGVKANALVKSSSATNCSVMKPAIAKPIMPHANSKSPHSVKINNYVQSRTLPVKKSTKSPNLARNIQRPKSASEKLKSNLNKDEKDGDAGIQSSDEDSEVCQAKLDSIRNRAIQRRQEDSNKDQDQTEKAAICIQRIWRGYHTRNLNRKATSILKTIDMMRTNKYIQKLSTDMEATRTALESEHKLQLLQMQAINALWKKVVSLQPGGNRENTFSDTDNTLQPNADVVSNLAQTCNLLHTQVQQLQDSMTEIKRCMSGMKPKPALVDNGVATQTEISAVHTPAGEENTFPYGRASRPQSLPIHQTIHEGNENKSFASNLVDSVLKKVSQSTDTTDDEVNTDILNSNENPEMLNSNENPEVFKHCEIIESDLKQAVENETTKDYKNMIEKATMDSDVCEEALCKELHNLIETENGADAYKNCINSAVNGDDKEIC
ncbi:centrosomal protein of 97 kDa isoform X2 [Monomorium pharaonis]|uniref:centrosomal protein of 97 kDa isoform X2 n=1 Tax=Monomorium pharaonis TaxID=307658 RepID=UPI00063F9BA8|nr:centrosomal protein of 97 kDa isoform X2 [Monomorium pharaonis]